MRQYADDILKNKPARAQVAHQEDIVLEQCVSGIVMYDLSEWTDGGESLTWGAANDEVDASGQVVNGIGREVTNVIGNRRGEGVIASERLYSVVH